MKRRKLPPLIFLMECFKYDKQTGVLRWRRRPKSHFETKHGRKVFNAKFAGTIAGAPLYRPTGLPAALTVGVTYNGKHRLYYAHVIIYHLMGYSIPKGFQLDHIDGDPLNNAWSNLRLSTHAQNAYNASRHRDKNGGLPKGVFLTGSQRFAARICVCGEQISLGSFDTATEAHTAYCEAAVKYFKDFARFD